jgi:hypothetical protein
VWNKTRAAPRGGVKSPYFIALFFVGDEKMRLTLHGAGGAVRCSDGPAGSLALSCVLSGLRAQKTLLHFLNGKAAYGVLKIRGLLRLVSAQSSNSTGEGVGCGRPDLSPPSHLGAKAKTDASSFSPSCASTRAPSLTWTSTTKFDENLVRMERRYAFKATTTRPSLTIPLFGPPPPHFHIFH